MKLALTFLLCISVYAAPGIPVHPENSVKQHNAASASASAAPMETEESPSADRSLDNTSSGKKRKPQENQNPEGSSQAKKPKSSPASASATEGDKKQDADQDNVDVLAAHFSKLAIADQPLKPDLLHLAVTIRNLSLTQRLCAYADHRKQNIAATEILCTWIAIQNSSVEIAEYFVVSRDALKNLTNADFGDFWLCCALNMISTLERPDIHPIIRMIANHVPISRRNMVDVRWFSDNKQLNPATVDFIEKTFAEQQANLRAAYASSK